MFVVVVFSRGYNRLPTHKEWFKSVGEFHSFSKRSQAEDWLMHNGYQLDELGPRYNKRFDEFGRIDYANQFDYAEIREGELIDLVVGNSAEDSLPLSPKMDWQEEKRLNRRYRRDEDEGRPERKPRRIRPEHRI